MVPPLVQSALTYGSCKAMVSSHWEAQPPVVAQGAAAALRTRPLPQPTASSLVVASFFCHQPAAGVGAYTLPLTYAPQWPALGAGSTGLGCDSQDQPSCSHGYAE